MPSTCTVCGKPILKNQSMVIIGHPIVKVRLGLAPASDTQHQTCYEAAENAKIQKEIDR